ncbi:MAG: 4-alpha-glucanotransferase [Opitutae bacterium]|nr:4-alpha-glucanotransferase [Opitutae bacterium]
MERLAGVILHPSSFPNDHGIGNFGTSAYRFIDVIAESGFKLWQMCPLGPTSYGDSPYQCFSAFAGNPYFINWDDLKEHGWIESKDLAHLKSLSKDKVDYGALFSAFWPVVNKAFIGFKKELELSEELRNELFDFYKNHDFWLYDYCNFRALKEHFGNRSHLEWKNENESKNATQKRNKGTFISPEAEKHAFTQFIFFKQFRKLKQYANNKGIQLIGDLPIFVALDSADVWANPALFDLSPEGFPNKVAGVPPDYFSEDGQLWGNPLFNWTAHKKEKFKWWTQRIKHNLDLYDCVRIDHFRGFESCWAVPVGETTAIHGQWEKAPGKGLFNAIKGQVERMPIIAEDLGVITPEVEALLKETGFPGMSVLHFAFGGDATNPYLPHNLKRNQVVYSGTHDNDTSLGWFKSLDSDSQEHLKKYLGISGENIGWDLFRASVESVANYAIVPMQDLFSLESEARFNNPGTQSGNWDWRYCSENLEEFYHESHGYIKDTLKCYGR